ncbi:MAG: methyltransferase domain-containing protein [Hyphomicrobiaceae bacterium]|nr:methyltransferase domain-containing protein [Hyphomicrobiaceae bacterium]
MHPIAVLRQVGRLKPGRALDIGARDFAITRSLAQVGYDVHAIDPAPPATAVLPDGVRFERSRLEDFAPPHGYDFVVASLVSHLVRYDTPALLARLSDLATSGGLVYATVIGDRDGWAGEAWAKATGRDRLLDCLAVRGAQLHYHAEECFDGHLYDGTPKHWHLHTLVFSAQASIAPEVGPSNSGP